MKIDITVGRNSKVNTGDFSNVAPLVSITARDVEVEDIETVHSSLDVIADILWNRQFMEDLNTMASIKKLGFEGYLKDLDIDLMSKALSESIDLLFDKHVATSHKTGGEDE